MHGTVNGFSYGWITPVAAYLMACLGGALALRCVTRSVLLERSFKLGWLALGAAALGCGIWSMHFIAMIGFRILEVPISYNVPMTLLSLAVAIVMVSLGVFVVGYCGAGRLSLALAGLTTGLGVAAMHYIGMAGMEFHGELQYNLFVVAVSVVIAVVAATAALWAAVTIRGLLPSLGASLVMGVAVSGMHYTGMAGLSVHLHDQNTVIPSGALGEILVPMLLGPLVFLLLAGVIVMFDPLLVAGEGLGNGSTSRGSGKNVPAPARFGAGSARNPSGFPDRAYGRTSAHDEH